MLTYSYSQIKHSTILFLNIYIDLVHMLIVIIIYIPITHPFRKEVLGMLIMLFHVIFIFIFVLLSYTIPFRMMIDYYVHILFDIYYTSSI